MRTSRSPIKYVLKPTVFISDWHISGVALSGTFAHMFNSKDAPDNTMSAVTRQCMRCRCTRVLAVGCRVVDAVGQCEGRQVERAA